MNNLADLIAEVLAMDAEATRAAARRRVRVLEARAESERRWAASWTAFRASEFGRQAATVLTLHETDCLSALNIATRQAWSRAGECAHAGDAEGVRAAITAHDQYVNRIAWLWQCAAERARTGVDNTESTGRYLAPGMSQERAFRDAQGRITEIIRRRAPEAPR